MDCDDKQNKFNYKSPQDDDNQDVSNLREKSSKEIEKMNSSSSDDKLKGNDHEETSEKPASRIYMCEYCSRKFFSGKSLGGHKRSHSEAPRKKGNKKSNCNDIKPFDEKYSCLVCNKDFPSTKSLYGHMRSHPDRLWRGIHPPIPLNDSDSIEENEYNDDQSFSVFTVPAVDASKSLLPGWPKTDKRGRQWIYSYDVVNGAQILMSMSQDKWSDAVYLELPQRVNLNKDANYDRLNRGKALSQKFEDDKVAVHMDNEEEEREYKNANCAKVDCCVKNMKGTSNGIKDCVSDVGETVETMTKMNKKRIKLMVKCKNLYSKSENEIFQTRDDHQHGFQGKPFSPIQVKRGHKSSHNKERNNKSSNDIREARQSGMRIRDFDLNKPPNVMKDKTK